MSGDHSDKGIKPTYDRSNQVIELIDKIEELTQANKELKQRIIELQEQCKSQAINMIEIKRLPS